MGKLCVSINFLENVPWITMIFVHVHFHFYTYVQHRIVLYNYYYIWYRLYIVVHWTHIGYWTSNKYYYYAWWKIMSIYDRKAWCLTRRKFVAKKVKKPTAPGVPRRSPIQVLTRLDVAWLRWSDENRYVQRDMAVDNKSLFWNAYKGNLLPSNNICIHNISKSYHYYYNHAELNVPLAWR